MARKDKPGAGKIPGRCPGLTAGVAVIGDELLDGRMDTNGPAVEKALTAWGIEPGARLVLPDSLGAVSRGVAYLLRRHDVVVVCGGLGPTQDDVTRAAVAQALGLGLEFKPAAWRAVQARFRRFKRPCTPSNRSQALVPQGAEVMPNAHGTAPGFFFQQSGKVVAALPGPPRELNPMLARQLGPRMRAVLGPEPLRRFRLTLRTCGVGESQLQEWLGPMSKNPGWPELGFLLDEPGEILVILTARETSARVAQARLQKAREDVRSVLGEHLLGDAGETLPENVGRLLRNRHETLAAAESCTGGRVCQRIISVPGSSAYFLEGLVTYSNPSKTRRLNVPEPLLRKHGAVSEPVVAGMARELKKSSGADWALATSGIAGPGGGSRQKPVGTVCMAVAGPQGICEVTTQHFLGDREHIQRRAATAILDVLRRCLLRPKAAGRTKPRVLAKTVPRRKQA